MYPYCLVDLDDQSRRTSSVQCPSVNPSWQEDLTFEVSVQQWVLSNLRIQVLLLLRYVLCSSSVGLALGCWLCAAHSVCTV